MLFPRSPLLACLTLLMLSPRAHGAPDVQAAWVVLGDNGQAIARAVAAGAECPGMLIDGAAVAMTLRAEAGTVPQRPTAGGPADAKPSAFPVASCEHLLPPTAQKASVGHFSLPLPRAQPQRIVVVGDSGCRMKQAENAWQDCSDGKAWPFAQIARVAAGFKPDLVLHVGDYHYRESPCPEGMAGCRQSPWGYGWDAWQADFFVPAAPLLAAAPWVMARGNHEECARAGQGWFRFLDVRPYEAARSCNDPANDADANYSQPYAVPVGSDAQIIVFDSAKAGKAPLDPANPGDAAVFAKYRAQFQEVGRLAARPGVMSMFADHHPILGLTPRTADSVFGGNRALLSVMKTVNGGAYFPPGVAVALHGHTHLFEAIDFASDHPATFLSGNSGDNVDRSLPDPLPAGSSPAAGVTIDRITHSNSFGFLVMDRGLQGWTVKAYRRDGSVMTTCLLEQRKVSCDRTGFVQ